MSSIRHSKTARVKLFDTPSPTKEMGGVLISSSNARRIERELRQLTNMVCL